jgi:hypothetical protein
MPKDLFDYRKRFTEKGLGVIPGKKIPRMVPKVSPTVIQFNNVTVPRSVLRREPLINFGSALSSVLKRIVPTKRS